MLQWMWHYGRSAARPEKNPLGTIFPSMLPASPEPKKSNILSKWKIIAVIHSTKAIDENKAWKNSGLNGIWTHDHCDIVVVLLSS